MTPPVREPKGLVKRIGGSPRKESDTTAQRSEEQMKQLFKTKSFLVGIVAILCGTLLIVLDKSPELGIAMITSGLGTITLRDAIRRK